MLTLSGCALLHATVESLRRHGPYSHFRRGPGSLWVSNILLHILQSLVEMQTRITTAYIHIARMQILTMSSLIVALILNTRASG
jgi:hypothetical protein